MKAALISQGSLSSKWTLEKMKKYFEVADNIDVKNIEVKMNAKKLEVLNEGKPLPEYDCIFAKGSFRIANLLRSLTFSFYDKVYMPVKPNAFTIGHDKLLTHLAFQYNKIPMPDTYLASSPEAAKKILGEVNYPIVLKFPQGTQGKGVMFADSFASASSMLDALESLRQPFLIQEYIETGGVDIRAFVVGEKVVAAIKRKAEVGEKRANIHVGGKGESAVLDPHTKKIAINAAKAIGAEICGVDILEGHKGPEVIEINLSPGLQGITESTGIDVADSIARYLAQKTKEFSERGKVDEAEKILKDLEIPSEKESSQQIVTNLDFRSERILLPKVVTKLADFDEKDEFVVKAEKGKIVIEKYS